MATVYKVRNEMWVEKQAALCRGILLIHTDPDTEYTLVALRELLERHGLVYSDAEAALIRDELMRGGVLEEVA